jgi:hypothetical protein
MSCCLQRLLPQLLFIYRLFSFKTTALWVFCKQYHNDYSYDAVVFFYFSFASGDSGFRSQVRPTVTAQVRFTVALSRKLTVLVKYTKRSISELQRTILAQGSPHRHMQKCKDTHGDNVAAMNMWSSASTPSGY